MPTRPVFGQTVVQDYWTPGQRYLYTQFTSSGEPIRPMTSQTAGASFTYQLNKRTEMRLAYRYQDLRVVYRDETGIVSQNVSLPAPFVPKHRLMAHVSREFQGDWTVDVTLQRYGEQPIPGTDPSAYPSVETAPAFNLLTVKFERPGREAMSTSA